MVDLSNAQLNNENNKKSNYEFNESINIKSNDLVPNNVFYEIKFSKKVDSQFHNLEDKLMKQLGEREINIILERLGVSMKIVQKIPGELICDNIERRTDYLGLNENGDLVNVEFQSTPITEDDIERFGEYATLIRSKERKKVYSIIISRPSIMHDGVIKYVINDETILYLRVYTLKNENGDIIQRNLKNKINNGIKFTNKDVIDFILSPLMYTERGIDVLLTENVRLLRKIKTSSNNLMFMEAMIFLEIHKFIVDENKRDFLRRELLMRITLIREIFEDVYRDARIDERKDFAMNLLNKEFSVDDIVELTKLSREDVLNLKNNS